MASRFTNSSRSPAATLRWPSSAALAGVRLTLVGNYAGVVIPGETGLLVPPARSRLRAEALRAAYATGLALITVSSANWPSPTLGCRSLSEVSSGQLG